MNTSTSRLGRLVPLAGAASALLTAAAYLEIGQNPDSNARVSTITRYYSTHHAHAFAGGIMLMYAAVFFALFGVAVWARIRTTALHPVVAGVALAATAMATVSDLSYASSWYMLGDLGTKHTISPAALQSLHIAVSAGDLPGVAGLGILLLAIAVAGIQAGAFPRFIAWSALVLGILQLAPTPGAFGFLAGLLVLPWMLVAGIAMFWRPGDSAPAAAPWVGRSQAPA